MMAEGQCACGSVRLKVEQIERGLAAVNHSKTWRKWTGAPFMLTVLMPAAVVKVEDNKGLMKKVEENAFCIGCGTPLARFIGQNGDKMELNVGILNEGMRPKPKYHIFCAEGLRIILDCIKDDLPRYEQLPTAANSPATTTSELAPQVKGLATHQSSTASGISSAYSSTVSSSASESSPKLEKILLRLKAPHIVNEADQQFNSHNIISVPCDAVVELVDGSLESGLRPPYSDYIEVSYNGKIGKISKQVVVRTNNAPILRMGEKPRWGSENITISGGLDANFTKVGDVGLPMSELSNMTLLQPQITQIQNGGFSVPQAVGAPSGIPPPAIPAPTFQPSMQMQPNQPVLQQQPTIPSAQPAIATTPLQTFSSAPTFIPSSTFAGPRPGYFFKTDFQGTGYYIDSASSPVPNNQYQTANGGPPGIKNGPPGVTNRRVGGGF